jgi:hypothetical protein
MTLFLDTAIVISHVIKLIINSVNYIFRILINFNHFLTSGKTFDKRKDVISRKYPSKVARVGLRGWS